MRSAKKRRMARAQTVVRRGRQRRARTRLWEKVSNDLGYADRFRKQIYERQAFCADTFKIVREAAKRIPLKHCERVDLVDLIITNIPSKQMT